ncbi:MAG TPA: GNVR domain-containing protein, partial [Rhizomicrobium sp.]|nr:GNVR domain-containing protein [Rhizomicrobium sp.]
QQRDLEAKVAEEVTRIGGSIANDVAVARAQVQSLQSSLQQAESQATEQNMASVELKSLEANATSTRTMYEAFVSRLRGTQDENTLPSSDARVISRAAVPAAPSSPKRTMIAVASVPAGVMLGLLIALLTEKLSGAGAAPVRRVIDFFRGLVVVADIPQSRSLLAADAMTAHPRSPFARAMSELAAEIVHSPTRPKVIAVTSPQNGEGACTVAVGLARAAAAMGLRVAMIDGNLDRPEAAQFMGANGHHAALTDVLAGAAPLSRAFQRDTRSAALFLCGTRRQMDPKAVFASPRMRQLLNHLRNNCDLVVVNSPAVLDSNAAPAIAAAADGVLMAVREPREAAGSAIDKLMQSRSAPIGIVLTR